MVMSTPHLTPASAAERPLPGRVVALVSDIPRPLLPPARPAAEELCPKHPWPHALITGPCHGCLAAARAKAEFATQESRRCRADALAIRERALNLRERMRSESANRPEARWPFPGSSVRPAPLPKIPLRPAPKRLRRLIARRSSADTWALLNEYSRTRDLRLRNDLVHRLDSFVRKLVDRFTPAGGNSREDLLQVGFMGLIAALERFDPSSGVQFVTFAAPTVTGVIKHYLRDQGWMVKAPRRLRELAMSLPRLRATLETRNGRPPTIREIADAAGVTEERLLEAMDFNLISEPTSLDMQRADPEGGSCSLAEAVGAPDPAILAIEDRETVRHALNYLSERHRELILCRFFRNYSQAKTASCLGLSQMHVSRLERQALDLLKSILADTYGAPENGGARALARRQRLEKRATTGASN
jgi:RNA polymerase sigma-B factor